ncbi:HlyD family efflux transporter periplasmic adaptor subunit [Pararhodobacter marinus]|uniref:HlyD family efflux transporter periplasmic adaptor subunit n=1 Tax=Pararhodobacter marinus TaxID=2184063 RepID=UPI0035167F59
MSRDAFDAEDFLNLRETAGSKEDARDLPPLVSPPVYPRARPAGVAHGAVPRDVQPVQARPEAVVAPYSGLDLHGQRQDPRQETSTQAAMAARRPEPQFRPHPVQPSGQAQARRGAASAAPVAMFQREAQGGSPYRAPVDPQGHEARHVSQPQPRAEQRSAEVLQPEFRHAAPRYDEAGAPGYRGGEPRHDDRATSPHREAQRDDPYRTVARAGHRPDYPAAYPIESRSEYRSEYRALAPFSRREAPAVAIVVREPMVVVHRGVEHPVVEWSVNGFTLEASDHLDGAAGDEGFLVTLLIGSGETRVQMRVRVASEEPELEHPTRFVFVELDAARADVLEKIVDHVVATQSHARERQPAAARPARSEAKAPARSEPRAEPKPEAPSAHRPAPADDAFDSEVYGADAERFRAQAMTDQASAILQPKPKKAAPVAAKPAAEKPARRPIRIGAKLPLAALLLLTGGVIYGIGTSLDLRYAAVTLPAIDANAPIEGVFRESLVVPGDRVTPDQILGYINPPAREVPLGAAPAASDEGMRARVESLLQSAVAEPMQAVIPVPGVDPLPDSGTASTAPDISVAPSVPPATPGFLDTAPAEPAPVPIYASCDCIVQAVALEAGDAVEPGSRAFVLAGAEAPNVQALLTAAQAAEISVGDRVMTRIGDDPTAFGRVERITAATDTMGRAGLEADVFGSTHYRRIEISTDAPIAAQAGTPARVTVQTFGPWGWARETLDPVLGGALGLFGW